jgi:hypothetical protein
VFLTSHKSQNYSQQDRKVSSIVFLGLRLHDDFPRAERCCLCGENLFSLGFSPSRRGRRSWFAFPLRRSGRGLPLLRLWRTYRVGRRRAGNAATLLAYAERDLLCHFLRNDGGAAGGFGLPGLYFLRGRSRGSGIVERESCCFEMLPVIFSSRDSFVISCGSLEELTHSCWRAI